MRLTKPKLLAIRCLSWLEFIVRCWKKRGGDTLGFLNLLRGRMLHNEVRRASSRERDTEAASAVRIMVKRADPTSASAAGSARPHDSIATAGEKAGIRLVQLATRCRSVAPTLGSMMDVTS